MSINMFFIILYKGCEDMFIEMLMSIVELKIFKE